MYSSVIWDFDGTLFDTYPAVADVFVKTFGYLGIDEDRSKILIYLHRSLGETFAHFAKKHSLDKEELRSLFMEHEEGMDISTSLPFPGASDMLQKVIDGGGRNLIYTNRGNSTFSFLDLHVYTGYFEEIITREDGFGMKPSPACINYFLGKYGIPHEDALMVGDRELDVLAAKNAGIDSCYFNSHRIPIETDADIYIDRLTDIAPYI